MSKKLTIFKLELDVRSQALITDYQGTRAPINIFKAALKLPPIWRKRRNARAAKPFHFCSAFEETKRNASPFWSIKDFRTITVGSAQLFRNASRFNEREPVSRAA